MNTAMVKKIVIVVSILVAIILISIGCNLLTREKQPTISDPNKPLLTLGDITVTRGEFYERAKVLEGLSQFILMTDEKILAGYIDAVTPEEYDEEMKRIVYGTTDQDVIDGLTEDELEEIERDFRLSLTLAGFNPDDDDALERFVKLNIAKYKATLEFMEELTGTNLPAAGEDYYNSYYAGDRTAIQLLFATQAEYIAVMKHFGLVPYALDPEDFDPGMRAFTGTQEQLMRLNSADEFTDGNTVLLSEADAFVKFVKMFDYLYPWRASLSDALDIDGAFDYDTMDLSAFNETYFTYVYHDMTTNNVQQAIAEVLFGIKLEPEDDDDEDPIIPYMTVAGEYTNVDPHRSHRVMYFVLKEAYFAPFETLPPSPIDGQPDVKSQRGLVDEYLEALVAGDEDLISEVMMILRENEGMIIHDRRLALAYEFKFGNDLYVQSKDTTLVASFYDFTVSADDFFDYLLKRIGAMYVVEIFKEHFLFASDYYETVFESSNRDVLRTNSELIGAYRYSLTLLRQQFSAGQAMSMYGMSSFDWWNDPFGRWHPMNYDFLDMLYLDPMYQYYSDEDALRSLAGQNLLVPFLHDHINFEAASPYMQEQLDNYFSLAVEHLIAGIDFDENLRNDDYEEFYQELTNDPIKYAEFIDLRDRLAVLLIEAAESDTQSLIQIATEFRNAPRGTTPLDAYHAYGIVYVLNGGTNDSLNKGYYRVSSSAVTLEAPIRVGYTFLGWYEEDDFSGTEVTEIPADAEEHYTLYAQWEIIGFAITYHLNGGTNDPLNPPNYQTLDPDLVLEAPTRLGFTFLGWYDNEAFTGSPITQIDTGSSGDQDLYAKWEINALHSEITYELNGGTNHPLNPHAYDGADAPFDLEDPVKPGYAFQGWYDNDDFDGDPITEITADPSSEHTLYAKWEIITYPVIYTLYGGLNPAGAVTNYKVTDNTKYLPIPTRFSFVFDGWYDNEDFLGDEILTIPAGSSGNVTLHAKWLYTDYSKWAEFKNYGFVIRYEALSNKDNPLNYENSRNFIPEFVEELQRIYALLEVTDETVTKHLDDDFFATIFGLHLVEAQKSTTNFSSPSAYFENEEDTYDARWVNLDGDLPNLSQMMLWAERQKQIREGIANPDPEVPESVNTAMTLLFNRYHNRFYPAQGLDISGNLQMVEMLLEGNATFTSQNDHLVAMLENMKTLYEDLLYP